MKTKVLVGSIAGFSVALGLVAAGGVTNTLASAATDSSALDATMSTGSGSTGFFTSPGTQSAAVPTVTSQAPVVRTRAS